MKRLCTACGLVLLLAASSRGDVVMETDVDRDQVDLRHQADVESWMAEKKPEAIFLAAGKVGGIHANMTFPVDFLYDNLMFGSADEA